MGSKLRGISRRQSASEKLYASTYRELAQTAVAWVEANGEKAVIFQFPASETVLLGEIAALPADCMQNDGARELWEHCAAHCPEATILMLQSIVERIADAAIAEGHGVKYDSHTVGKS